MTLNGETALIWRYFTEFGNGPCFVLFTEFVYDVVVHEQYGVPRFQKLLLIVYDLINTICAIIQRLFRQNKL